MAAESLYPFDEYTKVYWVPVIAAIAAPTVSELNAGTDITCLLTKDGLAVNLSNNMVDGGTLCSRFDGQTAGSVGASPTLKFYRSTEDTAWTLVEWGDAGYLVVRRGSRQSIAWAAANKVEVYHGQFGEPVMANSATNTNQTFEVSLAVSEVNQKAVAAT